MEALKSTRRSFGQKVISYLADNEHANDVTFVVGSTGEEILALKVALQAACPALDKLFKHNWHKYFEKGNLRVPLPDVDPAAFRIFLEILLWDDLEAEEFQQFNLSPETVLHLVKISQKLQMAEMQALFSAHNRIQGHNEDSNMAGQLNSFSLILRNTNQRPDPRNACASEHGSRTTGVHTEGSMSVAGNVITVIGTPAYGPIFVPPVKHFYQIDPPSPSFTGRTDILQTINSRMEVSSRNVNYADRIVVLCGLGGIGKTEIALQYAREFKSETYIKNVAWIDAKNRIYLKRSFDSLALLLNLSTNQTDNLDRTVHRVYQHFSEHIGNGLFIFDNAPQFNDGEFQILNYLPTSQSLQCRPLLLITSREQDWDIPPENKITVRKLTNEESVSLFAKKLKLRFDQQSPHHRNAILKLAEAFQGFPLGLSIAASNIDSESDLRNEIEEYLNRMEVPQGGWEKDTQSGSATKYNLVMRNVWEITLTKIKALSDGADAIKLLNLMAFSSPKNMTVDSMSDLFEFIFNKSIANRPFAILKRKSMISIETLPESLETPANQTRKIIRIHKLVQQCTRDNLKEDDAYFLLTQICIYVGSRKLNNDASHITSALICTHNHLKMRKWPRDSISYSVIFCSLMIFFENQNSDILFELVRDVYTHLSIESKKPVDMNTEDKGINLFYLCLIWLNKHNDIYPGYGTLLKNLTLRKENFENVVISLEKYDIESVNPKTEKMELHVLQKYLYSHGYHTLYTLMAAEKKQRISDATSKALLKYRSMMKSVVDDENYKTDDILKQTSNIAEHDAIEQFNLFCKPTKNNELTEDRAELTRKIQMTFQQFKNINKIKIEKAKELFRLEVAHFCRSYTDKIISHTEYPLISEEQLQNLHVDITSKLTEEFTQTFLDSPLLECALEHLTQQLNTERLSVYDGMKSEYRRVLNSANAQALNFYRHKVTEKQCCNFMECSNLHIDAKIAAIEILKKSNLIPPKILRQSLASLESKIDNIYIQMICSLDKQFSMAQIPSMLNAENASSSTCLTSLAIGIDFGTSFCRVAVLRHPHEDPKILTIDFACSTPSYVSYVLNEENSHNQDLQIFTGETAKQLASVNPENTVYGIKRLISRRFHEQEVQTYKLLWPFELVNVVGRVGVKISDEVKLPQVIASELLRHLKQTSEYFLRSPIDGVVVTIPVYYNDMEKDLTEWACHAAGFKNILFIAEPVAAAVAYGLTCSLQSHEDKTCLIYNLGGGTFEITVFRLDAKNRVEVKATGGDDRLGGEDFNDLLTEFCINEFKRIHGVNLAEGKTSGDAEVRRKTAKKLRRIRDECEVQKCNLSSATMTSVVVSLDNIYEDINLLVKVTRLKLEELIQPLLNQSMYILHETLNESGCKKEEIDDVILIGGSCQIPKVQQMVQKYFTGKQIRITLDADEAVACGAAVHAYNVFKENGAPFSAVTLLREMPLRPLSLEYASSLRLFTAESLSKPICWAKKIDGFPPRSEHAAVAVGNQIYSFGGRGNSYNPSYSEDGPMDVFALNVNKRENKWKKLTVKNSEVNPNQREGHSAVAHKEFILIFGGFDAKKNKLSNSTYCFNTQTRKWDRPKITGNNPVARSNHSAVVLRNEMLIYGGDGWENNVTNDIHSLNLESFCWSTVETKGIPPSIRRGHSTVYIGRFILIFGGHDYDKNKIVNTIHCLDVNFKTWTAVETRGTPPSSRKEHCAFVHSGRMYIFGGYDRHYLNDVFSYDLETCKWKQVTLNGTILFPPPRCSAGCVALNEQVFIFGGLNDDEWYLNDTHVLQM